MVITRGTKFITGPFASGTCFPSFSCVSAQVPLDRKGGGGGGGLSVVHEIVQLDASVCKTLQLEPEGQRTEHDPPCLFMGPRRNLKDVGLT